jgi:hypothetical protein
MIIRVKPVTATDDGTIVRIGAPASIGFSTGKIRSVLNAVPALGSGG